MGVCQIHEKGLKFGIYSCCGTHTCGGYPGSFEHEFEDAKQYADWGVDYLKFDNYLAGMIDREGLAKEVEEYWASTEPVIE